MTQIASDKRATISPGRRPCLGCGGTATRAEKIRKQPVSLNFELRDHRYMIGGAFPPADRFQNGVRFCGAVQSRAGPDVIEPPSAIRCFPIARAIAPPRIELLLVRH